MAKDDIHHLHRLALDLQRDLVGRTQRVAAQVLRSSVPLGTRKTSPEERLQHYLSMEPGQRMLLQDRLGPDAYATYEEKQLNFLIDRLGPAASILMPYVAPNLTVGIEQAMTGNLPGGEEGYYAAQEAPEE